MKRKLDSTARYLTMAKIADVRSLAIMDSDRGPPQDVRARVLGKLKQNVGSGGFDVECDRNQGAYMSTCSVSKDSDRLRVGIMTICPDLDELLARFVIAHNLHRPKKPLDASPKRRLGLMMNDLGCDDIAGLYEHLFSKHSERLRNALDRPVLKELCEFIR